MRSNTAWRVALASLALISASIQLGCSDDASGGDSDASVDGVDGGSEGLTARFTARTIQGPICVAPCAVHFDAIGDGASETTDSMFAREFHSLDFRWSFGDPKGETWAVSGIDKNAAVGGIAGHVYDDPGTYTVILRVTNPDGATHTTTHDVTVTDAATQFTPATTYCFATDGANWAGCPLDCAGGDDNCTVTSNWMQLVTGGDNCVGASDCADADANPRRILLRRGDTFVNGGNQVVFSNSAASPSLVAAFGSGANPIIDVNNGRQDWGQGWTITGVDIVDGGQALFVGTDIDNVTFYKVDAQYTQACIDEFFGSLHAYIEVNCTGLGSTPYSAWPGSRYVLWMGGTFDKNGGTDSTLRARHMQHYLIQHSRWIDAAPGREHWQFRANDEFGPGVSAADEANRFVLISDNDVETPGSNGFFSVRVCVDSGCNCGEGAPDCGGAGIGAGKIVNVADFIFERNFFSYSVVTAGARAGVFELQGGDFTIRNNVVDYQGLGGTGESFVVATGEPTQHTSGTTVHGNYHIYNNTIYSDDAMSGGFRFATNRGALNGGGCVGGCLSRNNLLVAPNLTGAVGDHAAFTSANNVHISAGNPFIASIPDQGATLLTDFRVGTSSVSAMLTDTGYAFSPATDTDGWVHDDAFGNCRPTGAAWDIGAHEASGTACPIAQ